ncbi:acyl-CoA dehydrogenase family protein [Yinghuangia sp. YIM S10712]|uniref:acyl-CoA dehydrogenase family protein n=1 Tax=Yinghuangia sp. YIM S10712 TaxID=3436930 RepID=UPI003F53C90B
MDLGFSDEQEALRDTLRAFLDKESPTTVVRASEPLGFDAGLWGRFADMGLAAIAVPEERGGGGGGFVELAVVAESVGRHLAPVPLVEAAVANLLLTSLVDGSDPELGPLAAQAVAGELLATVAPRPASNGVARLVPAGAVADLVIMLNGDELLLVRQPDRGPDTPAAAVPNLGTQPLADCRVDAGSSVVLAQGPEAVAAHERARRQWELLTGAALVGLGERALEIGVEYVLQRRAFGVLVGSFQAIQHRLADVVTNMDGARLLAYEAAWAHDENLPEAGTLATMAFLFAAESAFRTASESLHFHGGYGYTLEYDIQLYFRRAKAWPLAAGDPRGAYAQLAQRLFATKGA